MPVYLQDPRTACTATCCRVLHARTMMRTSFWLLLSLYMVPNGVITHLKLGGESFYSSPPNFSLTKFPVLKPTHGRVSCNTVPLATHPDVIGRQAFAHNKMYDDAFFIASFLVSSTALKRSLKKVAGFLWGAIVESVWRLGGTLGIDV